MPLTRVYPETLPVSNHQTSNHEIMKLFPLKMMVKSTFHIIFYNTKTISILGRKPSAVTPWSHRACGQESHEMRSHLAIGFHFYLAQMGEIYRMNRDPYIHTILTELGNCSSPIIMIIIPFFLNRCAQLTSVRNSMNFILTMRNHYPSM